MQSNAASPFPEHLFTSHPPSTPPPALPHVNARASGSLDSASRKIIVRLHSPRSSSADFSRTPVPLVPPPPPSSSSSRTRAPRPHDAVALVQCSPRMSQKNSPREALSTPAFVLSSWDSFTPFSAVKPNPPWPIDHPAHSSSISSAHPSPLLPSLPDLGQHLHADTSTAPADACPVEDWANFVEDWAENKFDAASISVVVDHLDWAQSNHLPDHSAHDTGVKRTLFVSLSRVLKLFKSQSRSSLLQRAFYTWHNLLRMRERRLWISCFCQKMCRRLMLRWVFCKWECVHAAAYRDEYRDADCTHHDDASDSQKSAVSSPSISLSELQSSFQTENPDFERLMAGFRQKLHVQTLQEKLQKDSDELARTISALRMQVKVQARAGVEDKCNVGVEEEHIQWQHKLDTFQSEYRKISLENLELKRVVSQQQSRLNQHHMNSVHRTDVDQHMQSQLQQENVALQRQVALFQQQFRELCDHPAVSNLSKGASPPRASPSFTSIRAALDSSISANGALDREIRKSVHESAELQRRLTAVSSEMSAILLENQELKRAHEQLRRAVESSEQRAATSEAAVKFLAEQNVKGGEAATALQRQLQALSCELQPAIARGRELEQTVAQLHAALQSEQARAAAAEVRCKQLETQCGLQKIELLAKMSSSRAAASARLSARLTATVLSDVVQQLRGDAVA